VVILPEPVINETSSGLWESRDCWVANVQSIMSSFR